jgi:hypothetical protein
MGCHTLDRHLFLALFSLSFSPESVSMDLLPLHKQIHKNNGILRENLAHFLSLLFCRPHPSDLKEVARQLEFFAFFLSFYIYFVLLEP